MCFGWNIERLTRSLGARILFWYALGFAGGLFLLSVFAFWLTSHSIERSDKEEVLAECLEDAAHYQKIGEQTFRAEIEREPPDPDTLLLRLSEANGHTLLLRPASGQSAADLRWIERRLQRKTAAGWGRLRTRDGEAVWQIYSQQLFDGRWLQLAKNNAHAQTLIESLRHALFAAATLVMLFALGGGAALTARALRPIRRLIETTRTVIASGDLSARVPLRSNDAEARRGQGDELEELSRLFNQMLARNERSIAAMREALDNVAHELRTPMTRLRNSAELALQRSGASLVARDEALADAIEESERVLSILKGLMDIAEAEQGTLPLHLEPLELADLLHGVANLYEPVAEAKSIQLTIHVAEPLRVRGDRVRLQQTVANLLDNAIKYSPPQSEVRIEAQRCGEHQARVTICDEGQGIEAEELPRIWDRLYRADKSRSRQRGMGLGLSLVKAMVEAHGGSVGAESNGTGNGAAVYFLLPLEG